MNTITNFFRAVFTELRLLAVKANARPLTNEGLLQAMTVNENLASLGYGLSADGVITLAKSDSIETLYDTVKAFAGNVKAKPMYPDFPNQVMAMSQAEFRFHQLLHYASTYGLEEISGNPVLHGWLPPVEDTEKTESDEALLPVKVLELIPEDEICLSVAQRILGKRERMSERDEELVPEAIRHLTGDEIANLKIPFKQNMMVCFHQIFMSGDENTVSLLHALCKHTGDVLKCADYSLTRCKYHFRTSQKRVLVKLLESYSVVDFKSNLVLSMKKANRSKLLLDYLDYGKYSRSEAHLQAVTDLRGGNLRSWESRAKYLLGQGDSQEALEFISKRPGVMFRMIAWLLRLGYSVEELSKALSENAASMSTQTMVNVLTYFGRENCGRNDRDSVFSVALAALTAKLESISSPLRGKRVFLKTGDFDLEHSELGGEKPAEGGYMLPGLAYRIPENIQRLRFFVYWNDKNRVDIDLHTHAIDRNLDTIHVGWNGEYSDSGIVFSGDITHSNAAEYIDVDMNSGLKRVGCSIYVYTGQKFCNIDEVFTGMMAVNSLGENVRLYDPKNCFFSHFLKGGYSDLQYGFIDVENRCLFFNGMSYKTVDLSRSYSFFNARRYLDLLLDAQRATVVDSEEDADVVLVMGKAASERELSLIDSNFFMDA